MTILTDIAGYIISHISLKNVMYYAIAIAFERILDGALRSGRAGRILRLLKSFVIALIVIVVLAVSYERKSRYEMRGKPKRNQGEPQRNNHALKLKQCSRKICLKPRMKMPKHNII